MATIMKIEDLDAWQAARSHAKAVYAISSIGRFSKDFILKNQIRRSAISAMSNIAEGFERDGNQEFL
jgi:four helix bundle protein